MIKQIPTTLLLLIYSIQASEPNAMQQISTDNIDMIYYKNQRINISFRDHNTFSTRIQELQNKGFDTIAQECHKEQKNIMKSICKEKESFLLQFKQEFNIPDEKWQIYIDLNNALIKSNKNRGA
jgi:hypothetical protein